MGFLFVLCSNRPCKTHRAELWKRSRQTDGQIAPSLYAPSLRGIINKSVFSLVPRHRPRLLLSAGACYRSISPARRALSSKLAARRCCCRSTGQTDRRTDAVTLDRTMHAASIRPTLSTPTAAEVNHYLMFRHLYVCLCVLCKLRGICFSLTCVDRRYNGH